MSSEVNIVHVGTHIQRPSVTFLSGPFVIVLSCIENHVCSSLAALGDYHSKTLESKYYLLEGVDSPCFRRKHVNTLSETLVIQIFE